MSGSAAAPAEAPVFGGPKFFREDLPLEQLRSSDLNPRKVFDEAKIAELAQSIRELGVVEPIVARSMGDHYQIVAGERRVRAARLAGLDTIPAIVRPLTDAQALEIMVVENNQRQDVNPLEEGDGFARLLGYGYELEKLAERIGRSTKYIYDRIKLRDLTPVGRQLLLDGRMTAGHGILLARLKPDDQARALDPDQGGLFERDHAATAAEEDAYEDAVDALSNHGRPRHTESEQAAARQAAYAAVKPRSVREFNDWLARHVRFDAVHAAQAAPLDFGETAEQVTLAAAKPGRGKKVVAITFDHYVQEDARDEGERTFGPQSWKFADGETHQVDGYSGKTTVFPMCEHSVLGLVVVGVQSYGRAFPVCIARDKCEVHWKAEIAQKRKNEKARESGKPTERQKADQAREREEARYKEQQAREESARKHYAAAVPDIRVAVVAAIQAAKLPLLIQLVAEDFRDAKAAAKTLFKRDPKTAEEALRVFALVNALEGHDNPYWGAREYASRAKRFGLDLAPILKKHAPPAEPKKAAQTKKKGGK